MMDPILGLIASSTISLIAALKALLWPALFFLAIGLIVKRSRLIDDIRGAMAETQLNLKIMVFNTLLVVPVIGLIGQLIDGVSQAGGLVLIDRQVWEGMPIALTIFIAIFIGDFTGYWRHRLEHTPLLWPAHAVHHSDTEMTWLTLERFHPINRLTTFVIDNSVLILLGVPAYALIANGLVRHYYGFFIHADLPWTYGRLSLLFVSPAMHRWHHAADHRFFDKNFATVFSVFDRAFGTYRVPGPCTSPLGVTDRMEPSLTGQLTYALTPRAYRRLFSRRTSRTDETLAE